MAELKATVCLQGKDIEVISSHIEFNRKTDNKGRPVTIKLLADVLPLLLNLPEKLLFLKQW